MLYRYGEFVARRARLLLVLSVLLMVGGRHPGRGGVRQAQNGGFNDPGAESTQAQQLIDDHFGGQTNLVLMVTAKSARSTTQPSRPPVGRSRPALANEADVTDVVS
jgi:RND superfamily putative drug exporter